jgi:hypothetical protein
MKNMQKNEEHPKKFLEDSKVLVDKKGPSWVFVPSILSLDMPTSCGYAQWNMNWKLSPCFSPPQTFSTN